MNENYESLKLGNQLCFPLYACAKEVVRHYKPYLDELDLTYTQYITMMVLWEYRTLNVKELGEKLYLDSGTLTPVLKKLESKGYITRERSEKDERNLVVSITKAGEDLRSQALTIPPKMSACANISPEEAMVLYKLLYKLLGNMTESDT
ncbi:MAG: MarR family transcriptional regulator [Lachnospiraceae bacterium]|nr:MarR family transcriptional regulator [Lachnospiraceae bacterium]